MSEFTSQTIEVEAFASSTQRSEAMQRQLVDILARIDAIPEVAASLQVLESAKARLAGLRQAQTRLMRSTHQMSRELTEFSAKAEESIIAGADTGKFVAALQKKEAEHRLASRAHQRLVERALPEAEIGELHVNATHLLAKARATRQEAAARIERTAQLMAEAAEFEGHISFDAGNTLSGALTAHAEEMESQADNYRRWAAERTEKHEKILRELESIQVLRG